MTRWFGPRDLCPAIQILKNKMDRMPIAWMGTVASILDYGAQTGGNGRCRVVVARVSYVRVGCASGPGSRRTIIPETDIIGIHGHIRDESVVTARVFEVESETRDYAVFDSCMAGAVENDSADGLGFWSRVSDGVMTAVQSDPIRHRQCPPTTGE